MTGSAAISISEARLNLCIEFARLNPIRADRAESLLNNETITTPLHSFGIWEGLLET